MAHKEQLRARIYYVLFGVPFSILDCPGSAFSEGSPMWSLSALAPLTPNASPHVQSWTSAFTQSLYVNHLHSMGQLLPQSRSPLPRLAFLTLVINALLESTHCHRTASSHLAYAGDTVHLLNGLGFELKHIYRATTPASAPLPRSLWCELRTDHPSLNLYTSATRRYSSAPLNQQSTSGNTLWGKV